MTSKHFEGEDLETRVQQLEEAMAVLQGDSRLDNLPYGTLKDAASVLSIRSVGGTGGAYPAGFLPLNTGAAGGTRSFAADRIWALPFYLPGVPNIISKIGIRVTTAVAGNMRLGIYADKGESRLYPHKLLLDAGAVSTGTTGVKSIEVRQGLPRGLVWVVMLGSVTPTITAFERALPDYATGSWTPLGWSEDGGSRYGSIWVAQAYGALPDPFPAGGTEYAYDLPYIFLKFA